MKCPICGEGRTTTRVELVEHQHNGKTGQVERLYQHCDACGEFVGVTEAKQNNRNIIAFRERA